MNAETGEILVMASHPTYDPNRLSEEGEALAQNPSAPLVNRATQGLYPIGTALQPLMRAEFGNRQATDAELKVYFQKLGLYQIPEINMPAAFDTENYSGKDLRISPLQAVLATAGLSNHGIRPSARIAMAVDTPEQGWVVLSAEDKSTEVMQPAAADETALSFAVENKPYWSRTSKSSTDGVTITWLTAGTIPDWGGTPLVLIVALEENNISLAENIRRIILDMATNQ